MSRTHREQHKHTGPREIVAVEVVPFRWRWLVYGYEFHWWEREKGLVLLADGGKLRALTCTTELNSAMLYTCGFGDALHYTRE